ncbi:unnamed protein product [Heterobilharzia americana]|nr:unnamed protein product [Heterobilharzia americana]
MSTDQAYRKSGSPEASTEVSSLQVNRSKNKEALEKRLRSRRPVKELVNQGILLNPAISNPDKVLQLQRAKTSDLLKRKIEQRPDRQYLISHHILRDDKPGTSPFILEQCHNLEKSQLKETLATKLISRPGSLELVEKGVLQVDPGVDSLIKQGSIPYPRVEPVLYQRTSSERLQPIQELAAIPSPPPLSLSTKTHNNSVRATSGRSRFVISNKTAGSRAIRDDTVVSKLGSLVFHQYCPDSSSSSSPSLSSISSPQQKQLVRELQQAEMLRLQDTARAHRLVERELCERVGMTYNKPAQDDIYVDLTSDLSHHDQIDGQPASSHNSNLFSAHTSLCTSNAIMCPKNQISSTSLRTNTSKVSSLDSTFSSPSLAHLNLTQLKGECKNRNLPRVGTKMQLMRLLDPYRHEILAKYFPNSVMHWNEERKSETNEHSQPSNCVLQQTQSSLQHQDHDHMLELNSRQASEVISERQMIGVNIRDFDSLLLSHTEPVSVCTTMLSSGSTLSKGLQEYSDIVMGSNCSNVLVAQPCVPLRHSVSAPFFSETSSESSAATGTRFQIPSGQGNISSTTLIPVTFLVDSASESDQISQIPVSSVGLQFVRTATKQSVVCVTPNLFPDAQTSNNGFGSENVNTSYYPVTDHLSKLNYTSSSQPLPLSTSIDSLSSCSETRSAHHIPVQNLLDNPVILYSQVGRTGSPSSTTLHQIEEMWLRIRQLRRNIAQSTTSQYISVDGETASNPGNLEHLQQEHNRLAVLCRLLIIERLDTLDEMDTNDKQNFHELKSRVVQILKLNEIC